MPKVVLVEFREYIAREDEKDLQHFPYRAHDRISYQLIEVVSDSREDLEFIASEIGRLHRAAHGKHGNRYGPYFAEVFLDGRILFREPGYCSSRYPPELQIIPPMEIMGAIKSANLLPKISVYAMYFGVKDENKP